ncbi:hypothetical protein DS909_02625 [Phaeobacter gallaeciensis]|uniref:Uncharacterized protein n=1 Tax=Phaeobacter gallaeciensis TaxID=60890 RepID=A0A366X8P3_9RHOB|nr:hypothetical protein DS909_02625 [Phaeobacter gallaeciensis]
MGRHELGQFCVNFQAVFIQFAPIFRDNPVKAGGIVLKLCKNRKRLRALTLGINAAAVLVFAF